MKHLSLTILAAAVLGLASPAARADFIVDDGSAAKPKPAPVMLLAPASLRAFRRLHRHLRLP